MSTSARESAITAAFAIFAFGAFPVVMCLFWAAIPDRLELRQEFEEPWIFLWIKLPICGVMIGTTVAVLFGAFFGIKVASHASQADTETR